jgi:FtsP/CotA-like multicopper oxidase with cupredoxin domain
VYATGAPARPAPLPDPKPLPANPLPERIDFRAAYRLDIPLEGGAMSAMMMDMMRGGREVPGHGIDRRARIWTMAGSASSGHHGPPLFSVKRGRTVVLAFVNRTAFPHGMHVHGHHFRLLDNLDDGWKPYWLDTVLVAPQQTARIAFVADNPGKWMIHCHMLEHHDTGMGAWFEVA